MSRTRSLRVKNGLGMVGCILIKKGVENREDCSLKTQAFCLYIGVVIKEFLSDREGMVAHKQVAIYARVSTLDKGRIRETQLLALRAAARRGFVPAGEYVDYASGRATIVRSIKRCCGGPEAPHRCGARLAVRSLCPIHPGASAGPERVPWLGVDFISCQENIDTTTPQGR